ncbi:MAG TPA: 3-deoxy-7-phosphoheptulonate synthase [Candidatus Obscuribacterales bacterium]
MILVLQRGLDGPSTARILDHIRSLDLSAQPVKSGQHTLVVVDSDSGHLPTHVFTQLDGVEKVLRIESRCPLAVNKGAVTITFSNAATIGGETPVMIAGPCSVEGQVQTLHLAQQVKAAGANLLRGGAYKPRTSPYDFRGLGLEGFHYLREAREATGLPIVSEVMSPEQVERAEPFVDMYQIGARNMYNYELLKEVGRSRHPVLLKRAMSATLEEFLQAAEYIMLEGNLRVVLCERGIRTFETHTRNTLDLSAVAALKTMTGLPVIVDPSHGTGRRELIRPMSRAAIACGADGLLVEVHDDPRRAVSDGVQAITPEVLREIVADMHAIARTIRACDASFTLDEREAMVDLALPRDCRVADALL